MKTPIVAVTGLNATDNPGPGVSLIRALRSHPDFSGRIVGLAYDALDPGLYAQDLIDDAFLIPYPSEGLDAIEERLRYIRSKVPVDVLIPTLDAELPEFIALESVLGEMGIHTFLPSHEQLELRSKAHLLALAQDAGIETPEAVVLGDVRDLYEIHEKIPYPFFLKGVYYGAIAARSIDEAVAAYHRIVASWGLPVIVQQAVRGRELDVAAVGDGRGGLVGAIPMRKTYLTEKGKGWAGIAIADEELLRITQAFMQATQWRGPCEVEVMRTEEGEYFLLEINPRFPAWIYLSAGAGINLPYAVMELAQGKKVSPMTSYDVGTMFVRISLDQIASLSDFERLVTNGEMLSEEE